MLNKNIIYLLLLILLGQISCSRKQLKPYEITIENQSAEKKVGVYVDGQLFTNYLYDTSINHLKKPVLYPVLTPRGTHLTRGYPIDPRPGERTDHPHHIGIWLNYGDVNGFDLWNNSDAISPERQPAMGKIQHREIIDIISGKGEGRLTVKSDWLTSENQALLEEKTEFVFHAEEGLYWIDRITHLSAHENDVFFKDNKEGMIAMRVARFLEHPSDNAVLLSDEYGKETTIPVLDNTGVTGSYLNSEGIKGTDVWGKRARWVILSGKFENENVAVGTFDFPQNTGYPTYWHARGYGLFAANPLGQNIFSEGRETLNFSLPARQTVTFKHRLIFWFSRVSREQAEAAYQNFISE